MSQQHVRPVAAGLAVAALFAGCGSSAPTPAPSPPASTTATAAPTTAATTTTTTAAPAPRRRRPPSPPPGSLPQTHQLPSAHTAQFRRQMAALWRGVQVGSVRPALAAFFPEGAYAQVKAIADPDADYASRLVAEYALDIGAAHALLGTGPAHAQLVRVAVPQGFAHWVPPGVCYNRIGYYEVPNARLIYAQNGRVRSFGVASMISWRGVWYVVHLGAVVRSSAGGVVDDPSNGPGTPTPSSTC